MQSVMMGGGARVWILEDGALGGANDVHCTAQVNYKINLFVAYPSFQTLKVLETFLSTMLVCCGIFHASTRTPM